VGRSASYFQPAYIHPSLLIPSACPSLSLLANFAHHFLATAHQLLARVTSSPEIANDDWQVCAALAKEDATYQSERRVLALSSKWCLTASVALDIKIAILDERLAANGGTVRLTAAQDVSQVFELHFEVIMGPQLISSMQACVGGLKKN